MIPIYVCHAPWLTERRERLEPRLSHLNPTWYTGSGNPVYGCPAPMFGLNPRENDAFMRHWGLLETIALGADERAVILEDDADIVEDFADRLKDLLAKLQDADVVILSAEMWPPSVEWPHNAFAKRIDGVNTLVGYVVTREAADIILRYRHTHPLPVDWYISHAIKAYGLVCVRAAEPLVRNGSLHGVCQSAIAPLGIGRTEPVAMGYV